MEVMSRERLSFQLVNLVHSTSMKHGLLFPCPTKFDTVLNSRRITVENGLVIATASAYFSLQCFLLPWIHNSICLTVGELGLM